MYKWNPDAYKNNSTPQLIWARDLIEKLELKGTERILDIGCGDGKITAEIASHVPNGCVVGVDSSNEMIGFAQNHFPGQKYANLSFCVCSAAELDVGNDFDIVFSNSVLHWINDHFPVLKGIKKSLKQNGRFFLQMAGKGNGTALFNATDIVIKKERWTEYFIDFVFPWRFYEPDEYRVMAKEIGLHVNSVDLVPKTMIHKTKESFHHWLEPVYVPYLHHIPEYMWSDFLYEVIDEYCKHHPVDSKGNVNVLMTRLIVEGVKGV